MKLKDMKIGLRYVVTTNGTTLKKGDHIYLFSDNCIDVDEWHGWIEPCYWKRLRNEVDLDRDFYLGKIATMKRKIKEYEEILETHHGIELERLRLTKREQ